VGGRGAARPRRHLVRLHRPWPARSRKLVLRAEPRPRVGSLRAGERRLVGPVPGVARRSAAAPGARRPAADAGRGGLRGPPAGLHGPAPGGRRRDRHPAGDGADGAGERQRRADRVRLPGEPRGERRPPHADAAVPRLSRLGLAGRVRRRSVRPGDGDRQDELPVGLPDDARVRGTGPLPLPERGARVGAGAVPGAGPRVPRTRDRGRRGRRAQPYGREHGRPEPPPELQCVRSALLLQDERRARAHRAVRQRGEVGGPPSSATSTRSAVPTGPSPA